jgi:hypothetical protein
MIVWKAIVAIVLGLLLAISGVLVFPVFFLMLFIGKEPATSTWSQAYE